MTRKRILFVDDNHDFLTTRAEFLRPTYEVITAATLEEAEDHLRNDQIHLAILDIRLADENDEKDRSGLTLAQNREFRHIPKVILTAYPSVSLVRDALHIDAEGIPSAVEFLAKEEGAEKMVRVVDEVFARHIHINWSLALRWENSHSFFHLAYQLAPAEEDRVCVCANRLADLFRKLFYYAEQITIGRPLVADGGTAVVDVSAYNAVGIGTQYLVACGNRAHVEHEVQQYQTFVQPLNSLRMAMLQETEKGINEAVSRYSLNGHVDVEALQTFGEYWVRAEVSALEMVLSDLYSHALSPWHTQSQIRHSYGQVQEFYRHHLSIREDDLPEIEDKIATLSQEILASRLGTVDKTDQGYVLGLPAGKRYELSDPIVALNRVLRTDEVATATALFGLVHGQTDAAHVLVSPQMETYLFSYANVSLGPLLHDFVSLELAIRLDLVEGADLATRCLLEDLLCQQTHLGDPFDKADLPLDLVKPVQAIEQIRRFASLHAACDMELYSLGLFYCAMERLKGYDLHVYHRRRELLVFAQTLIMCGMMAARWTIAETAAADAPADPRTQQALWLDPVNKVVWVDGHKHALTPREFLILHYMWERPNQLCEHQKIAAAVDDLPLDDALNHEWLTPAISRLRRKIEPDSDNPRLIESVRGLGYKLNIPT